MQRAPVFVFDSAREARDFAAWVQDASTSTAIRARGRGHLERRQAALHRHLPGRQVRLSALQLLDRRRRRPEHGRPRHLRRLLVDPRTELAEGARAPLLPRVEPGDRQEGVAGQHHAHPRQARGRRVHHPARRADRAHAGRAGELHYHAQVANVGTILSGANNNGAHSPNGITAMFIATGQDVANVSESSAGIVYTELTPEQRPLHLDHDSHR